MQDMLLTLLPFAVLLVATLAAGHALLYKRDTRAVIAWVGLIMLVPLAGAILYWMLGVNRVRRRAVALRPHGTPPVAYHSKERYSHGTSRRSAPSRRLRWRHSRG